MAASASLPGFLPDAGDSYEIHMHALTASRHCFLLDILFIDLLARGKTGA